MDVVVFRLFVEAFEQMLCPTSCIQQKASSAAFENITRAAVSAIKAFSALPSSGDNRKGHALLKLSYCLHRPSANQLFLAKKRGWLLT